MKKTISYSILSLALWLPAIAHSNQLAISEIDSFKISGISLTSTIDQVDAAMESQKFKMNCEKRDMAETKRRDMIVPSSNYRKCLYRDSSNPVKWKMLRLDSRNGKIKRIEYTGTMTDSEDIQIVERIRDIYKKLKRLELNPKQLSFTDQEIVGASSPVSIQKLSLKQKELCKGFPVGVSLETEIMLDLPSKTFRSIKISLERDSSNNCDRPYRVSPKKKSSQ